MIMLLRKLLILKLNNMRMNKYFLLVTGCIIQLLTLFYDVGDGTCNIAIAPIALGALALGGGAALNSWANSQNRENAEYSLEMQKRLMDYEWKNFNSPKAQIASLAEAGLNPAVALGQGGFVRGVSPSGSAPQLAQSDIGLSGQDFANTILALSQAKKAGSESAGQELDNIVKKNTINDQIKSVALANHWTDEQTAKVTQEIGLMSGQFQQIQQNIENMRSEKQLTDQKVSWFDRHMSAEINHLKSQAEYNAALKGLSQSQKQLLDDTMESLKNIAFYQSEQIQKIVGLLDKYGDAQAIVGMISQVVSSASDLLGNFVPSKKIVEHITK